MRAKVWPSLRTVASECACGEQRRSGQHNCRACHAAWQRQHRRRHGELTAEQRRRANCRSYTHVLIARGRLLRGPCDGCGTTDGVEAHHDDYDQPRQVRWQCRRCYGLSRLTETPGAAELRARAGGATELRARAGGVA